MSLPMSEPDYERGGVRLYCGDCLDVLPTLEADIFTACVCDSPYELGFMGKAWDSTGVAFRPETWAAVSRVMKPGAMLLAFGGTRTFHRLACAIEDAGWEIRDTIMWVYGSGFPKSLDVSKAIDKAAGVARDKISGGRGPGWQRSIGNIRPWMEEEDHQIDGPLPATPLAAKFNGYGTALKPAWEPIILARKPLDGTVAQNVQKWGTGALNIDGCRIGTENTLRIQGEAEMGYHGGNHAPGQATGHSSGRFPANLCHDGSDEVLEGFPETSGGGKPQQRDRAPSAVHFISDRRLEYEPYADTFNGGGSAARFFYTAKASKSERGPGNNHPTVKPLALMRYLCRLVTPPEGGLILDLFMGSGTTALAAVEEGNAFVGVELEKDSFDIAVARIDAELDQLRLPGM